MKITLIGPVYPYRGGIAHYTSRLVEALSDAGHTLQVISFQRQYPTWLYPGRTDRDPSYQPLRVPVTYLLDPLYPWTWQKTIRAIEAVHPDLVVIQWWTTFWAPAFSLIARAVRRRGHEVVFSIHNVLPHECRPWDPKLARLALQQGDRFLLHTEREQVRLENLIPGAHTVLAPLPRLIRFNHQQISKEQARRYLGIPLTHPTVLCFGLIRPYKGLHYAIEAIAHLRRHGTDVIMIIAGEFWEDSQWYLKLIRQLGVADLVRMDNRYIPNEEVSLYFSAADIFLAPYTGGTQSGALKDALGFGLPAVVSHTLISGDLTAPNAHYNLHWVNPTNIPELAQAILESLHESSPSPVEAKMDEWGLLIERLLPSTQPSV